MFLFGYGPTCGCSFEVDFRDVLEWEQSGEDSARFQALASEMDSEALREAAHSEYECSDSASDVASDDGDCIDDSHESSL